MIFEEKLHTLDAKEQQQWKKGKKKNERSEAAVVSLDEVPLLVTNAS